MQERLYLASHDAYLWCIDAKTGTPVSEFGEGGKVDLTEAIPRAVRARNYTMTSPPVVCRDVVAVGASISDGPQFKEAPRGDVQAFDVRTGKPAWLFHVIPQEGEFGNETWENGSWKYTGNANVWTLMSADEDLGYIYLPFSTPTNDWYGGQRLGNNLFAESLVCVEAATRQARVALSDRASRLVGLRPAGRAGAVRHPARRQADQGRGPDHQDRLHVRLRSHDGEPVWPIEERPVPQSTVPGERTSPTQPFPTKPAPYELQGSTEENLIDFTPELRAEAKTILDQHDHGPLFTPPTERGTINLPGWAGGANWWGAAFDPDTGLLYVPSISMNIVVKLNKPDAARSNFDYVARRSGLCRRACPVRTGCRCSSPLGDGSRPST